MTRTIPAPTNGLYSDMEDEDNQRGPERDETDAYQCLTAGKTCRAQVADRQHRLNTYLLRLVAEGDALAAARAGMRGAA
ncbi:hypothetical protein AB0D83_19935 [Streptomyces decoyicus]|uniref:hypothetical protein n=1 Tax=Streptomyces decoyicus TaxID=249567 RepID=UPI0033F2E793